MSLRRPSATALGVLIAVVTFPASAGAAARAAAQPAQAAVDAPTSFGRENAPGWDLGPPATPELVARVVAAEHPTAPGPFEPTWESLAANYRVPAWFRAAKFGLYMHWGLYSIPAHQSEWYVRHMYCDRDVQAWHVAHFGPVDKFGYKDFIPRFTVERFDPDQWAELFAQCGARYVTPTVEHCDGFSLWDSKINPYNAAAMGPHRDLMGELCQAVRRRGLKFGVCNHSLEHFTFIDKPLAGVASDLNDPAWADFYSVTDRSDAALEEFLKRWIRKNVELIDKFQPDLLWFDNGVNHRVYDPLKLTVAAYYYNRARQWGQDVSIVSKKQSFLAGSIMDYERQHRAPTEITDFVWQPDDPIGPTFGYTSDMPIGKPETYIRRIVEDVSRNGNYGLNISPAGDGSIPDDQQEVLRAIGAWLAANGEAIYGTRPWRQDAEGDFRFTAKGDAVYAIAVRWPGREVALRALARKSADAPAVQSVRLLGYDRPLEFVQTADALRIDMPDQPVGQYAYALKVATAKPASLGAADAAAVPRLVLIGDSTVKNGRGDSAGGLWGWGQVLAEHFDPAKIEVENRALGGRSSRTYLTEGLWQRSLQRLRKGDFLLIQFGHNDGGELFVGDRPRASLKGNGEETKDGVVKMTGKSETVHTYGWYLRRYIADAKAKGATPIIVSPVPRNMWKEGKVLRASGDYGRWAAEAAQAGGALFFDLNDLIARRYEAAGQDKVARDYFTAVDHTHTTEAGARVNAACVVEGIRTLADCSLREFLKPPTNPQTEFQIPPGPPRSTWKFDFGPGTAAEGYVQVVPSAAYSPEAGYGFEPGAAIVGVDDGPPPFAGDGCTSDEPFRFSIRLPEGNYRVAANCYASQPDSTVTIKAELRRLMVEKASANPPDRALAAREFTVNIRTPALPDGKHVHLKDREKTTEAAAWDDKLTLEFSGAHPTIRTLVIEPEPNAVTVFLAGDSTVTDQPTAPWNSWGQMLPRFFRPGVAVANHSESGESVRSSLGAGRFDKIFSLIKPGDYLFIQFGHNDMKDQAPDALATYRTNLERLVDRTRERRAIPVLVTSMERKAGVDADTLGAYPQTVRDVAQAKAVPLIDLHAMSKVLYQALGADLERSFQDGTRHTDFGSYLLARCVVESIRTSDLDLARYFVDDLQPFDPAHPDLPQ